MATVKDVLIKAREYEQTGQYDKAIKFYQAVVDRMPNTQYSEYATKRLTAIKVNTTKFDLDNIENKQSKSKSKLYNAFLLNILSIVIPAIIFVILLVYTVYESNSYESSNTYSIELPNTFKIIGYIAVILFVLIIVIGFIIYFSKKINLQKQLSYVYFVLSMIDLAIFFISTYLYAMATCGLLLFIYVPNILQIIAGRKFIRAIRELDNES